MGASGVRPRKRKLRLAKVPRGEEVNNIQLAGLSNDTGGPYGPRVGHENARGRSENIGKFSTFLLRLLGRRTKEPEDI
jgi:hypothetical protein